MSDRAPDTAEQMADAVEQSIAEMREIALQAQRDMVKVAERIATRIHYAPISASLKLGLIARLQVGATNLMAELEQ